MGYEAMKPLFGFLKYGHPNLESNQALKKTQQVYLLLSLSAAKVILFLLTVCVVSGLFAAN